MKHRLFLLHEGFYEGLSTRIQLLKEAAESRNIECIVIDSLCCDYSNLPRPGFGDLLYNCGRGSQILESLLLNDEVTTFYVVNPPFNTISSTSTWTIIHDKAELPAPKTIFVLTQNRENLRRYVDYLGGFPLVLKAEGSTRGVGTIKVDSWEGLVSLADHALASGQRFMMRQFIDAPYGARAMVLGNKVIGVLKFFMQENDFRNAALFSDIRYESFQLSAEEEALCVKATRLANLEMSGVDLLFDRAGKAHLLEINFPTGFQSFSGEPWKIQEQWMDYLLAKIKS